VISTRAVIAAVIVASLLLGACGSATSPAPRSSPVPSAPLASSSASPTSGPSVDSTALPSLPPEASATLPVHGSARAIGERILIAPGPDGTLFVSIPRTDGSVLVFLDRSGQPRPGWPITINDSTSCGLLLPVEDSSVRVLCTMENPDGNMFDPVRAHRYDRNAILLAGWPVDLPGTSYTGRGVGDDLALFATLSATDVPEEGKPDHADGLAIVAANGSIRNGIPVPMLPTCCRWDVAPDGLAYGIALVSGNTSGSAEVSRITALDLSGIRAGWPVSFEGIGSGPAFRPDGRIAVTVASTVRRTSRVLVFDRDGEAVVGTSAELQIMTGEIVFEDGPYECGLPVPRPPLVASEGTMFVFSEIDTAVYSLDPSLSIKPGWPYEPAAPLVGRDPRSAGDLSCSSLALPAVGPDSTLYLPLQARNESVGGSLVALGPDGRMRPGWPVELRRPGSEFWSVTVGSDGTAYALAIEPEASGASSASILAIAPDSTVRWTTTVVDR